MTLNKLMTLANDKYPNGDLALYWDFEKGERIRGGSGDTLAEFAVVEICETFDGDASDEAQRAEAARVLRRGADDLNAAADGVDFVNPEERSHGPRCMQRFVGAAECDCGKADASAGAA